MKFTHRVLKNNVSGDIVTSFKLPVHRHDLGTLRRLSKDTWEYGRIGVLCVGQSPSSTVF